MMEEMDHGSVLCERYVYIHVKFFLKRTHALKNTSNMCVCVYIAIIYLLQFCIYLYDTNLINLLCIQVIMREKKLFFQ